ncbi:MAG: methyltransferase domain-containing protein [Henriciella sp.]|nr:methyltransferase domain-containing protein [Henriciella sp.]
MKYAFLGAALAALSLNSVAVAQDETGTMPVSETAVFDVSKLGNTIIIPAPDMAAFDYSSLTATVPGRPDADYADYEIRKVVDVLAFAGVMPGMTVVELEAGGGFYTELLASAVGDEGTVYQQNAPQFDGYLGDSVEKRGHLTRYSNIEYMRATFDALTAEDASADMVTWFLGPHELWFTPGGVEVGHYGDPADAFAEIARVLKPGGVFVALDHAAPDGAPTSTGNTTHRIDKAIVVKMAEEAGLTLVDESDVLANPEDDRTGAVFAPAVRRKTDRFLIKFKK